MSRKANNKTDRQTIQRFDEIINIGPAMTRDFELLGIENPQGLIGQDPLRLYQQICELEKKFYDPCVLDVYIATVDYMNGNPPKVWWHFTKQRKRKYTEQVDELRGRFDR